MHHLLKIFMIIYLEFPQIMLQLLVVGGVKHFPTYNKLTRVGELVLYRVH